MGNSLEPNHNSDPAASPDPQAGVVNPPARVKLTVEAAAGSRLEIEVETHTPDGRVLDRHIFLVEDNQSQEIPAVINKSHNWFKKAAAASHRIYNLAATRQSVLIWAALVIYTFTRMVAIQSFPIYFFTDEAVQTVLAADFLRDHFQNYDKELLPAFFKNGAQYNLGTSVYLQVAPYLIFGKSIWVTRGMAALTTLIAAFSLARIAQLPLKLRFPWLAILLLSITPAWFLHSRTAFETSLATTFYALFLYLYLQYRCQDPRFIYGAILAAGLTFYSYSSARIVILVTILLLILIDARYHWQQRKIWPVAFGLSVLVALPFIRFLMNHPLETSWQMRLLGSYWISQDLSLVQKIGLYLERYLRGLDPLYWYIPHDQDLARHTMLGYGHLGKQFLPFGVIGLGLAVVRFRQPVYRTLLAAVVAAPSGAAMIDLGVTRALTMVIPMALLTAAAISWLIEIAIHHKKISTAAAGGGLFLILAGWNCFMLGDSLINGPTWYRNYGLPGMQYGARQLFQEVESYIRVHPGVKLVVSPSWSNGTDVVARFFFDDPLPFQIGNADGYYTEIRDLDENTVFVLTPDEYAAIPRIKFKKVEVEKTLPAPDGLPAFYFLRMQYAPNIQEILAAEAAERQKPIEGQALIDGTLAQVQYTRLDMGNLAEIFDRNEGTLIRTDKINPFQLHILFSVPRPIRTIKLMIGGVPTRVTVQAWTDTGQQPVSISQDIDQDPNPRYVTLDLGQEQNVREMLIEILNRMDGPDAHVHLWEVNLK